MFRKFFPYLIVLFVLFAAKAGAFDIVLVKWKGSDSYNNRDALVNFLSELNKRTSVAALPRPVELSLEDDAIFQHYFLFIGGHLPFVLNDREKAALRKFVLNGGFVFANDDFGMDESFRKTMKEVFPEYPLQEIAFNDPVYHCFYDFQKGLPKIHEHYEGAPKAFGIYVNRRIAVFYNYNSDIGDGWDYPEVHNDTSANREAAFRMGVNVVIYSLSN